MRMRALRRFHSDTVFFVCLVAAVAVLIAVAVVASAGRMSAECDDYGNLVYRNSGEIFVVEGADGCSRTPS